MKELWVRSAERRRKTSTSKAEVKKECVLFLHDYLLKHPCKECGESDPVLLEFDHRDRTEKSANVTRLANFSLAKVKQELLKCDVLCVKCHRIRTAIQLGWYSADWHPLNKRFR